MIGIPSAYADGCAPGEPCWEQYKPQPMRREAPAPAPVVREVIPTPSRQVIPTAAPVAAPVVMMDKESPYSFALSGGANILFNDCHDESFAVGAYGDVRKEGLPLNFRLGVEVAHLNATQFAFTPSSDFFGEEPDFAYVRIPLSVEYIVPVSEKTEFLVGGGPDLIHTSGNGADLEVGAHIGARFVRDVGENLTASVGAGYLWAENSAGNGGEDLGLDSAFTGASLGYKF